MSKIELRRKLKRFFKTKRFINKKLAICISAIAIVAVVLIAVDLWVLPQIKLKGNKVEVLNYKEKYKDKGYKASFLGEDITSDVSVSGKVNSAKLGEYNITYTVKSGFFTRKVTRKVLVKDMLKPKLDIDNSDVYLCPGSEIVPEKVKATDNYDGDISKKVKTVINNDKIIYRVSDSSGNIKEVEKKIFFADKEGPKLSLEGLEYIYTFVGDNFDDPGAKANDNCDGDVKVTVDNSVNMNAVGEYKVIYKAQDSAGNSSEISRTVKVSERGANGTIYLTFDDGPNSGTTNVILDILKEEGVPATFFVTNKGPDELIKREYDEGHTVALHTATHDYAIVYASADSYFNDLYSVQERVKRITGYESKIIRFPGGSSNTISRRYTPGIMSYLTTEVLNRGFKYYDWNLSSGDAAGGSPSSSDIYNNVVSNLRKDRINMVLMHDIKTYTRDALRDIIHYGKNNGYTFEKITMETEMVRQRVNN